MSSKLLGIEIPDTLRDLYPDIPEEFQKDDILWDCFYRDGSPVFPDDSVIYPCYANRYMGRYLPGTMQHMVPGYGRAASSAAIGWVEKLTGCQSLRFPHQLGKSFTATINDTELKVQFPIQMVKFPDDGSTVYVPIIVVPDTAVNNDAWDSYMVPDYVENQARLLSWCYRMAPITSVNTDTSRIIAVRITGNTPSDITVRTILSNREAEDRVLAQVAHTVQIVRDAGQNIPAPRYLPLESWSSRRESGLSQAYHLDDPSFYTLVKTYMSVRSNRLQAKKDSEGIKKEMDAIAIALADATPVAAGGGKVEGKNMSYTIRNKKARRMGVTVSAALVRQFYPQYAEAIRTETKERGRIAIDTAM